MCRDGCRRLPPHGLCEVRISRDDAAHHRALVLDGGHEPLSVEQGDVQAHHEHVQGVLVDQDDLNAGLGGLNGGGGTRDSGADYCKLDVLHSKPPSKVVPAVRCGLR